MSAWTPEWLTIPFDLADQLLWIFAAGPPQLDVVREMARGNANMRIGQVPPLSNWPTNLKWVLGRE